METGGRMTKEDVEALRALIKIEIDYAANWKRGYSTSYNTKESIDVAWQTFTDSCQPSVPVSKLEQDSPSDS